MAVAINWKADLKKSKNEPIFAAIYARYSSHSQTEQSIEGQLASGRAYAREHGYTVTREYCDRATTGRNDNREQFQQMLSDLDKHLFDVIITWKIDRIGRNREDIAFNKHRCKRAGIRIEYVAENLPDSAEAIILESVLEGMAEYYSVQLSANVKRGMLENAKKCQYFGGPVPLGYTINPTTRLFEIDEKGASVVREIFNRYANGNTEFEIIEYLNERGVRTSRGSAFGKSSLAKLLHNEKYVGVYAYKDQIRVEDGVPAIVDRDTFQRVQDLMKVNRRAPSHKWTHMEYILTGKLFCGHCGSAIIGASGHSKTGSKYGYYVCKRKREKLCSKKPVRQDWIEDAVLKATRHLLSDNELLDQIADATYQYYVETHKPADKLEQLNESLRNVNRSIQNLLNLLEQGNTNPSLINRLTALESQKTGIETAIAEEQAESALTITRDQIAYFLHRYRDADIDDRECQKRLIQTFVNAIYVYDDRAEIVYNSTDSADTISLNELESSPADHSGPPNWTETNIRHLGSVFVITVHK